MTDAREVLDNVRGAGSIAAHVALRPWWQRRYRRWGATDAEAAATLPGDERVPHPWIQQTLALDVAAPPERVWPWVAQIGQERAGLYSYALLENLARCRMRNADEVRPEWALAVGDLVRLGPEGYPCHRVVGLEPYRWLLLSAADPKTTERAPDATDAGGPAPVTQTWLFHLGRQEGGTRLLTRSRLDVADRSSRANRAIWQWVTDPVGFVMTRRMLEGIAERAEGRRAGG